MVTYAASCHTCLYRCLYLPRPAHLYRCYTKFLRNELGLQVNQQYFNMMHLPGTVFIFILFLYPYVYTVTRGFMAKHTASLIESARVLGHPPRKLFLTVILPLCRGALIGGVSLVIMEVLNDYGVVKYYGVPVFSTAIFKAWFSMGDVNAAIRLSALLMVFVLFSCQVNES